MFQIKNTAPRIHTHTFGKLLLLGVLMIIVSLPGFGRQKDETIEATAMGTGTQMGANIGVTLIIYEYSTPADKQILVQAYEKGQNEGLVNALRKMRSVGRVEITGTVGNDCSYISMTQTPTGRKIKFITNRQIRMAEAWTDSQSMSFDLTAGEFDLNDTEKHKSTGALFPALQIVLDKAGQLQLDLTQNPWKLVDVLDWKGTPGVN